MSSYQELKKANPTFPILIRECAGVEAKLIARYGKKKKSEEEKKRVFTTVVFITFLIVYFYLCICRLWS
jgi:hypothetical protein